VACAPWGAHRRAAFLDRLATRIQHTKTTQSTRKRSNVGNQTIKPVSYSLIGRHRRRERRGGTRNKLNRDWVIVACCGFGARDFARFMTEWHERALAHAVQVVARDGR